MQTCYFYFANDSAAKSILEYHFKKQESFWFKYLLATTVNLVPSPKMIFSASALTHCISLKQ